MTNPNDPWARRPDEDPTQRLGQPGESPTEKLTGGYGPAGYPEQTTAYPGNDPYGGWGPGPYPTREMPAYDSRWGGYGQYGAPGGPPPQGAPPEPPRPPRRTGMWVGVAVAAIVLIGLAGVAVGLFSGGDSEPSASGTTTSRTFGREIPAEPEESGPALPSLPGLPDMPDSGGAEADGTTMGTIDSNSGGTLILSTLGGSEVTVHTTPDTQVISLAGTTVDDLPAGDLVIVQGQKSPDGSIQADVIISTALEGGGR